MLRVPSPRHPTNTLHSHRLLALAEASVTETCGRAMAAGMRRRAEVYKNYNEAALVWQCVQVLPQIAGREVPTIQFAKFS